MDYSRASDVNYMKDMETSSLDSKRKTALLQLGKLDYLGDKWMANVADHSYESQEGVVKLFLALLNVNLNL